MKMWSRTIVRILMLLSLAGLSPGLARGQTPAPDERETHGAKMVQQAIEALGGKAYLSVKDFTLTGRTYSIFHGTTSGTAPFVVYVKYPDKERQELGKKKESINIYNGDKAWNVDFRGAHPLLPKEIAEYHRAQQYSMDRLLRFELNTHKYRIYFDGTDFVEATKYDIVTLEDAHRHRMSLLLNARTHLPEALRYRYKAADGSGVDKMESWVGNYRRVDGIMTPFHREMLRNGERISETFITGVKYNTGLADSLFLPR